MRVFSTGSPFSLEQRPIVYRPVGALSRATRSRLEPALFAEVAAILAAHPRRQGAHPRRLVRGRAAASSTTSASGRRANHAGCSGSTRPAARPSALDLHRASTLPTVLVSPSLREGVDLPDDFLRFQVRHEAAVPRPRRSVDGGAASARSALVRGGDGQGAPAGVRTVVPSRDDHGVTYVLDAQFASFLQHYRRAAARVVPRRRGAGAAAPPRRRGPMIDPFGASYLRASRAAVAAERPAMRPNTAPAINPAPPG